MQKDLFGNISKKDYLVLEKQVKILQKQAERWKYLAKTYGKCLDPLAEEVDWYRDKYDDEYNIEKGFI